MVYKRPEWNNCPYKKPKWATSQIIRSSGLVEDICEHGVGHPNVEFLKKNKKEYAGFEIHGCCGCCKKVV